MVKVSSAGTSGEVMEQHDMVEGVAGKRYTVGKDMRLAASANDAVEELVGDFVLTDERGARLFGAMPCLNTQPETAIDWLLLGLPLTTDEAKSDELDKRVVGRHIVTPNESRPISETQGSSCNRSVRGSNTADPGGIGPRGSQRPRQASSFQAVFD
ncbi:MAG TPA: hypothetical protein PLD53_07070 [Candidatus Propionivibrio aalborgensis]|nr:hypothetical protein [Candidatus Propionivibrio aalborgensis]